MELTIERAFEIQEKQSAHYIRNMTMEQKEAFLAEVEKLNRRPIHNGFDVARGTELESIAWRVRGKSQEDYRRYLDSMD